MRKAVQHPPAPVPQDQVNHNTRAEHPATDRFLRINQVLEIFPVARSTWWKGCKDGIYPRGVKLSERTTAWRESELMALIERLTAEGRVAV